MTCGFRCSNTDDVSPNIYTNFRALSVTGLGQVKSN